MPVCGNPPTRISGSVEVNGVREICSILNKISTIKAQDSHYASGKNLVIRSKGFMVWWNKLDEAANYILKLFVIFRGIEYEVNVINITRERAYYTFTDLINMDNEINYAVIVEAEDKSGKIIDSVKINL